AKVGCGRNHDDSPASWVGRLLLSAYHQNALRKRTSDLSSILLDYGSVDDLDSFESELTLLMTKNSVPPGDVAAQVERRREILVEREQEREDESYNPAQSVSPWQSATDQIRSMFAGLAAE
ncbi:hypothetical protein ACQCRI_25280, partial [Ralstonia pseudosolanacearum]|uniref:hypothetical protein n=1 Tax=Ralstonia pseudosolanacearum TaxID=1310165 RepID=UPI003CF5FA25